MNSLESDNSEKYYKKFDFFFRRTAFRTMTEYYKSLFRPNLLRWREFEKKQDATQETMSTAIEAFQVSIN